MRDLPEAARPDLTCDVAVIGAGTAGIAAERSAREHGARTLLIDPEFRGTLCANTGCMPSKLLIVAARAAHDARRAPVFGVQPGSVQIDGPAVMARLREERDRFVEFTRESFDDLPPDTAITGRARFTGPATLMLEDGRRVEAKAVVIATGSAPVVPAPFRDLGPRILTNETLFELPDLPDSLAVIGGGPIGLELAQAMGRLGVAVTLFDHETRLGKAREDDIHDALSRAVGRDLTLCLGADTEARADPQGIRLDWSGDSEGHAVFSHVLVATGRAPLLDDLDLTASGLDLDDHGTPVFDRDTMRCGGSAIFIAGDADADVPLLHEASTEGEIAGRNAACHPRVRPGHRSTPFTLTFTDPPLAQVGEEPGDDTIIARSDYSDQGRARAEARAEGLVVLYADPQGRLTGAELCCPGAEHLSHLLVWAVQSGATAADMLLLPFYHPTLEEGLKGALNQICRQVRLPEADRQASAGGARNG
ncbi:dihydrolipoyl dehydrogenase [Paracoccus liaowanqingii]|uniref:Dihydrolipoyl dehydrogenase n=1 Tax=Paracoccus liaowanqingii TaxID=2560053 RepID=A0A4Z1CG55_9RHOB|nr:dihydrolipoyl dehydrogenase [Paracoccus liaowanqingii]TGN59766.1 dihydrolipoyl dehydrogenase [Paracoccus liaowanqingii]